MRKILYSPGFGAGWSSWNSGPIKKLMLTYQPIIDAIERGESMILDGVDEYNTANICPAKIYHPAVCQLIDECNRLGYGYVCVLGASSLRICEVADDEQVKIDEYDGSESVCRRGYDSGEWM